MNKRQKKLINILEEIGDDPVKKKNKKLWSRQFVR